jgi:hypothetical protein
VEKLLAFLRGLDESSVHYGLAHYTASDVPLDLAAVTVHVTPSPSERWEVEFNKDGTVEVERFCSDGPEEADAEALLAELRADASDGRLSQRPHA